MAMPVPGLWDGPHVVAGPKTTLAGALEAASPWPTLDACVPFSNESDGDGEPGAWYMSTFWAPEHRADLNRLATQGTRSIQVRRCAAGSAEQRLREFLDRAWLLGLRVVLGLTPHLYFGNANNATEGGCYSIGLHGFECYDTVRAAYRQLLRNELVENGRYHPALDMLLLMNEPSRQFYERCAGVGLTCTQRDLLRALVSAWDGVIAAEREFGVLAAHGRGADGQNGAGLGVRISAVLSATDGAAEERWERPACHHMRAPPGCTGEQPARALFAAVQDYRLTSVVHVLEGVAWPYAGQIDTTLEQLRSKCFDGQELVSIRDAGHVRWLQGLAAAAGVNMSLPRGVLLGYDYDLTNRYFDLRNTTREVTHIFDELRGTGGYLGDYHTNQTGGEYSGMDERMAGFGWGRGGDDAGIADFGHRDPVQAIVCEHVDGSFHGLGYTLQNDVAASYEARWTHGFESSELTDNVTRALTDFNEFLPQELVGHRFPGVIVHYEGGVL